jgi:hypothetical protein
VSFRLVGATSGTGVVLGVGGVLGMVVGISCGCDGACFGFACDCDLESPPFDFGALEVKQKQNKKIQN